MQAIAGGDEVSEALSLAVEGRHGARGSTRRSFRPLARLGTVMDIQDVMFRVLQFVAYPILFSTISHVGWKIFNTDLDYAVESACKISSLDVSCRFLCEHVLIKSLFPNVYSGHR